MKDYRIYYYEAGTLIKFNKVMFKSSYNYIAEIQTDIEKHRNKIKDTQLVIVEYTGKYKSKIVEIIDL